MVLNTRATELTQLVTMLRRAAYLRALLGDRRDHEIIIDELMTTLLVPSLTVPINRLAVTIDQWTAAIERGQRTLPAPESHTGQ